MEIEEEAMKVLAGVEEAQQETTIPHHLLQELVLENVCDEVTVMEGEAQFLRDGIALDHGALIAADKTEYGIFVVGVVGMVLQMLI